MRDTKKKNIILSVVVLLVGFLLAGGTYAYLTRTVNVTNGNINAVTTCFDIDYTDNTDQITGTLFPSTGPNKGLGGSVTIKVNNACDLDGAGTLYIHVNSGTSTKFGTIVDAHCENARTLETLPQYTTQSACTQNGGSWVPSGTPLKFALYDNNSFTGNPLAVGNFYNQLIGNEALFYSNFVVTKTAKTYYIYVWLDGYLTDNTYTNLPFSSNIRAEAIQTRTVYTANVLDSNVQGRNIISIGQPISSGITEYNTPEAAIAALKNTLGGTANYPYFLKHIVNNNVVQSYVGFVVTSDMATANPEMTAGTYYLRGGDNGASLLDNAKTIYDAFGGVGCRLDGNPGGNPYTTVPSSGFFCDGFGWIAAADSAGDAFIVDRKSSFSCFYSYDGYGGSGCDYGVFD